MSYMPFAMQSEELKFCDFKGREILWELIENEMRVLKEGQRCNLSDLGGAGWGVRVGRVMNYLQVLERPVDSLAGILCRTR